ncbi:MAG: peptidase S41 [Marinilabiliales bacterium]|nr:MAG: peptidase S41 [Marinilabiliales bacterium]
MMKQIIKHIRVLTTIIIMLLNLAFLVSCEKMVFEEETDNNPKNNFDFLWNEVDGKYAFLQYKNVNWDSIYEIYSAKIYEDIPEDSLFLVLGQMLNELRDGHVNLFSEFNISRYDISLLGPVNIDERIVKEFYLGTNYYITCCFEHNFIKGNQIGYIQISSFYYSEITEEEIDYLLNRYKDTKGLIIDIRQNGGGYVTNVFYLLSLFSNDSRLLYSTQIKTGPDAEDFSTLSEVYSTPRDGETYDGKIAILTDRGSYSASSFFSVCTYAYDNVFLVGDTTGGGLGLPNGGQLPNGWTYRFSITRTIAVDGGNYESGVPPDYTVILDEDASQTGIDNVIEFASIRILE